MLPQILRSERTILFVPLLSDTYSPEGKGAVPTIINKKPLKVVLRFDKCVTDAH